MEGQKQDTNGEVKQEEVMEQDEAPVETVEEKERIYDEKEKSVGIHLRVGDHKRFTGIIKHRFEDFVVREIGVDGEPVGLTNFKDIELEQEKAEASGEKQEKENGESDCPLSAEEIKLIGDFVEKGEVGNEDTSCQIPVAGKERAERRLIHEYIQTEYNMLTKGCPADTADPTITVYWQSTKQIEERFKKRGHQFPPSRPPFLHFTVQKHNMDTQFVLTLMSKFLRIEPKRISFAGTKDKRSVAYQRMSIWKVNSSRMNDLNRCLRNIAVGDFKYCPAKLNLGDLKGNQFTVVLRDINAEQQQIDAACESLQSKGFLNYYGLQRFGSWDVATNSIGKLLLQGNFEEAVNLILAPRENEHTGFVEAKKIWAETKDAVAASTAVPKALYGDHQAKLLQSLKTSQQRGKIDYAEGFRHMPYQMRTLYLHSYQSYIYNFVLSKRIERFGYQAVEGDLILVPNPEGGRPIAEVLTKETAASKTIYDIVLPLPGSDVVYPTNMEDLYKELLETDGLDTDMNIKAKEARLFGAYRNVVVLPSEMSWETLTYTDHTKSLSDNDFNKITGFDLMDQAKRRKHFWIVPQAGAGRAPAENQWACASCKFGTNFDTRTDCYQCGEPKEPKEPGSENGTTDIKKEEETAEGATIKQEPEPAAVVSTALRLTFTLPSSAYATSAFRELLSNECSLEAQRLVNQKYLESLNKPSRPNNNQKANQQKPTANNKRKNHNQNRKRKNKERQEAGKEAEKEAAQEAGGPKQLKGLDGSPMVMPTESPMVTSV